MVLYSAFTALLAILDAAVLSFPFCSELAAYSDPYTTLTIELWLSFLTF